MNEPEDKLRSALARRASFVRVDDPRAAVRERIGVRRKRRRKRLTYGSAALALLVAVAVLVPVLHDDHQSTPSAARGTGTTGTTEAGVPRPPGALRSQLVRDTRPVVSANELKSLTNASTQTALDLYGQLAKTPGNVFFSPYSISTALGMAAAGARGQTLSQMLSVLHNRLSPSEFQATTNGLNLALLRPRPLPADGQQGQPLELEIANSEWSQSGYPIEPSFLDLLARDYGAGMNTLDFARDPDAAVAQINQWVAQHTNDKIKQLFAALDPATKLVLVNAVHFKASWVFPFFPSQTVTGPFTTASGHVVHVPFMHGEPRISYSEGDGWQAADLPYIGDASMTVVMPTPGTLSSFERSLDTPLLARIVSGLRESDVTLAMPKLQLTDHADLIPALQALGMTDAFGNADFSGITNPTSLAISQVVHQATITVDERGTEAAAATGIGMTLALINGHTLTLDHPYLFFIRDTKTGAILFMGRVTDPTQTSVQQP